MYEISFSQKYMELYSSNAGIFGKRRNTGNSCSSKNTGNEQTIPDDVLYLCSAVTVCIGTNVFADVFTLWKGQLAGVISALTFSAYGLLLNPDNLKTLLKLPDEFYYKARVIVGWISPLNQATYSMHNFGYDNLPSLKETFLIFGSILTILVFLSTRQMKRYNFQFRGTEE